MRYSPRPSVPLCFALAAVSLSGCATADSGTTPAAEGDTSPTATEGRPSWTDKGLTADDALIGVGHAVTPRNRVLRGTMAKNRAFARLAKAYETCGSMIIADWIKDSAPHQTSNVGRWVKAFATLLHDKVEVISAWDDSNNSFRLAQLSKTSMLDAAKRLEYQVQGSHGQITAATERVWPTCTQRRG
ncbi:MAG: hypothetical protein AAFN74_02895 [Myxococcota bacterium]